MTQDKAPDWAIREAVETIKGTMAHDSPLFIERVSLALSRAYERGQESMRERAAAEAWLHSKQGSTHDQIAEAIRSLPIEQEGGK